MKTPSLVLRAHHLQSAKLLHRIPRELVVRALIAREYIHDGTDAFVDFVYRTLKKGFSDLSKEVQLQVGGLDIICTECPKHKTRTCTPESPQTNRIVGEVFLRDYAPGKLDTETILKYNLNPKRIYTIGELREIMSF